MRTPPDQLQQWLTEPEGTRLKFKEAKARYDFEKLLKYCVALANEGGGKIVLGMTDRRPRGPMATPASKLQTRPAEVAVQPKFALSFNGLARRGICNRGAATCNQGGGQA